MALKHIEQVDEKIIKTFSQDGFIDINNFNNLLLTDNEYLILKNNNKSVLTVFNEVKKRLYQVVSDSLYAIKPRNAEQAFAQHAIASKKINLVTLTGKAGTGKTLLALNGAL